MSKKCEAFSSIAVVNTSTSSTTSTANRKAPSVSSFSVQSSTCTSSTPSSLLSVAVRHNPKFGKSCHSLRLNNRSGCGNIVGQTPASASGRIKKTNSFSCIHSAPSSSFFSTNSPTTVSKVLRVGGGKLTKLTSSLSNTTSTTTFINHSKLSTTKTNQSLIVDKEFSIDNPTEIIVATALNANNEEKSKSTLSNDVNDQILVNNENASLFEHSLSAQPVSNVDGIEQRPHFARKYPTEDAPPNEVFSKQILNNQSTSNQQIEENSLSLRREDIPDSRPQQRPDASTSNNSLPEISQQHCESPINNELSNLEIGKCNAENDSDDSDITNEISTSFIRVPKLNTSSCSGSNNIQPMNHSALMLSSTSSSSSSSNNESDMTSLQNHFLRFSTTTTTAFAASNRSSSKVLPIRNQLQSPLRIFGKEQSEPVSIYGSGSTAGRINRSSHATSSSSRCCYNHPCIHHLSNNLAHDNFHRVNSMIPVYSIRQSAIPPQNVSTPVNKPLSNCGVGNSFSSNSLDLGMSPIEATTIISSHCNTENNSNAPNNSSAVTKLSSSSSGYPVTALTVMELPKMSSSRNGSYNWQALMSTLKDRMATIFNCELLADVHFIVGKGSGLIRFPAHKFVLSIGSAVFDAMFNGPLARASLSHAEMQKRCYEDSSRASSSSNALDLHTEIELPDIEPEAFQALLRFLYLDEVQIGPETVMATLYAAKKYEVPALENACVEFLKANISSENAFMLLSQARLFDEAPLADLCLETIDKHTMDSLHSDSFFDIDLDTLKIVLQRDSLRVREVSLFVAALRWAEFECTRRSIEVNAANKRAVLDDALYLIRFPLMTIEEFAHHVAQSELLTDKEVVNLFLYFTVASKPSIPFSFEPRCCIVGEECSVNRFQRTECRWGYSGTSDRIRFITDRQIFVIGFGLFGSIHGPSEYEANIEIIHTGSGKVIASNTTSFVSDGSDSTFRVMFKYPVEITQNTNYTACATLKGVDSFYGTNGYRTVTVNLGKGESKGAVTFQFSYAAGCNNGTSVEDGQIPEIIFCT